MLDSVYDDASRDHASDSEATAVGFSPSSSASSTCASKSRSHSLDNGLYSQDDSAGDRLLPQDERSSEPEDTATERGSEIQKQPLISAEYKTSLLCFLRIFSYSTWAERVMLFVAIVASICTGITLPLMNIVFGDLVGAFSEFYNPKTESKEAFIRTIDQYVLYIVYLFLGRLVLGYLALMGFRMTSIRISAAIRLAYLEALFYQPISILDTLPPGQTAAIITITANTLQIGISEKLSTLLQSFSLVVTALSIAFYYSWHLTLVTSSGLLFIVLFYYFTVPCFVKRLTEVECADRMSSSIASEVFSSIRMIAACEAEGKMSARYSKWVEESRRRGVLMSPVVAIQQAPVYFAIHATFALSFWYAIKLYMASELSSVKIIIIILMSIMSIVMSIGGVVAPATAAAQAAGASAIFHTIIDAPRPCTSGVGEANEPHKGDIVLQNVNFAYPSRSDVKVLDDLSLRFPAGKLTAIVGASGSGKSTIVGLIERWYELDGNTSDKIITLYIRNGTITAAGKKLHDLDLKQWRSKIGLVQQEPFLFNDTIFKNVAYGLVGTKWEHDRPLRKMELVMRACKEAFADEFIARLPQGYDTIVGDAGIKLSGGQRQRLAIARSIVKKPTILILDEATSAIDARGETMVQAALDKVAKNRTTITIAHRLSTIMKADNIIVLQKGKAVQQGTHDELLADRDGPYWALANAQQLSLGNEMPYDTTSPSDTHSSSSLDRNTQDDLDEYEKGSSSYEDVDSVIDLRAQSDRPSIFRGSFGLFMLEQKPKWMWYSVMLLGALGAGLAFPVYAYLFAKLIGLFSYTGQYLLDQTNFWCLMFTFLAIGVGICYFTLGWSSNTISFNITAIYRQEYFQNVLAKPVAYFDDEDNSVGALTARMASDPTQLQQLLGINMAVVLISVFNILGCVSMSFYFGWKLTLVTICSAMPIILAAGYYRIRHETQFEKMNHEVFAESAKFATESIGAIRTVSSLTLEAEICDRYAKLLREHTNKAFRKAILSVFVFAMTDSISLLCMAFVLWYGGQLLATHDYSPFNYLVIYLAIVQGSTSAGQSLSFGPNIAQAFAAADRIRGLRPRAEFDDDAAEFVIGDLEEDEKQSNRGMIELKHVHFKYPTRDVPVLNDFNMTIGNGQFAAIVGPSGCGKTSIISLLERFYEIQKGEILYEGRDISNIPFSTYRKSISLVAQEAAIFSGTIESNILLGVDEDSTPHSAVEHACRSAEIHDFISSLPEGYNTMIGANGVSLSGGQKQRIAIARALIRQPKVLLLDEATSNLDSETERQVQAVLERERAGRTMVVVAHRLATVQNADIIFVIGDGRVVEKGDHRTLLCKKGLYWQMCQSQALDR